MAIAHLTVPLSNGEGFRTVRWSMGTINMTATDGSTYFITILRFLCLFIYVAYQNPLDLPERPPPLKPPRLLIPPPMLPPEDPPPIFPAEPLTLLLRAGCM